jgi:excisionase family DNA binding protein
MEFTNEQIQEIIKEALRRFIKDKPKESKHRYVSIKEFATYFGMHKQSISNLIRERKIYAEQMFGTTAWRIPIEEVENYKEKSRKQTKKDIFQRDF